MTFVQIVENENDTQINVMDNCYVRGSNKGLKESNKKKLVNRILHVKCKNQRRFRELCDPP